LGKNNMFYGTIAFLICGLILIPNLSSALELEKRGFANKNFAGARVGAWTNSGDEELPSGTEYSLEFDNSSIYGEFFYSYRLAPMLAFEVSLGIYSRGDVQYSRDTDVFVGAVNLYPMFVTAKLYPFFKFETLPFYIYAQPGAGLVYASQSVIDYDDYYYYGYTGQESETKFTYSLGGGVDWPIAEQVGLTMNYKYIPVKFGEPLAEVKDYSGWTLTFGVGYIF